MIDQTILNNIRNGVCAIGYLPKGEEEYKKNPTDRDLFRVSGTGFLVRENTVITNRHVIEGIKSELKNADLVADDRTKVQFTYFAENGWQTALCSIEFVTTIDNKEIDIGLIDIKRQPEKAFEQCKPLEINDDSSVIFTSQEIAMFGFPGGSDLFVNPFMDSQLIYRFGPVLQRGYISALAPFERPPISRILSDIRTYKGMSGSPVFLPKTGKIISLHEAGSITTAFSIPLSPEKLAKCISKHGLERQRLTP